MNPFSMPRAEIQEAIAILEQARGLEGAEERKEHARQAIPALGTSNRFARKLAQAVERLVEDDDLDRAIALLQKMLKGDGGDGRGTSRRSPKQVLVRLGVGLVIPLVVLGIFFAVSMSGGDKAEALVSLEQCRESQRALGTPIGVRRLAMPGVDNNDNPELARRALPVEGSGGAGRYHYLAEETGGAWAILHGALEVDGQYLMVVPCGGSVSEADAEGRLSTGYRGRGSARYVEGPAPVQAGDACSVEVHPDPDFPTVTMNCRVVVTCGGQALYGATPDTGYVFCSVLDGAPAMAVDDTGSGGGHGGDPMIRLNLPGGEVQLSDDAGWSFTIDLEGSHGS